MSLAPGFRLGTYEILGPLGAGGMGEVYRARDGKLARHVAIKVLPPALSSDPIALARFEQEAKAVAALSHPNILAIYDFAGEAGTAYAVMELLEGSTLRRRLEEGPLPFRKAVELAAETALGLAAAHEKGIVHRDLKPENLFVTADGRLKILDFGLARQSASTEQAETQSPTAAPSTEPGTVLGTVGYMSPEQVRGRVADARSDIFSLGAVLLEMVTGRRAFQRETAAETMTAILREDPAGLDAGLPAPLEQILRHCLEKSPDERFRSARDLAFALQAIVRTGSDRSGSAAAVPSSSRTPLPVAPRSLQWRSLVLGLVFFALGALGARFLLGRRPGASPGGSANTLHAVSFQQLTDTVGVESAPSLSPDGKSFVFVSSAAGKLNIYAQRVGGRNATLLTGDSTADDRQPAFSPDGERIAFRSERDGGGIFVMGSTGESVKRLTDFGFNPSWSPDGKELAVSRGTFYYPTDRNAMSGGLVAVNVETGRTRVVSEAGDVMQPAWSPHGKRIAYWGLKGKGGQRDLFTVAADGSEAKSAGVPVTDDPPLDWSPTWSPDGNFLWFSSNRGGSMNLWRLPIDEASGRTLGEPEPMTTPSLWSGEVSFSRDGTRMAFSSVLWRSTILKAAFDAKEGRVVGTPVPILGGTQPIRDHEVAPDGEWVAFDTIGGQEDLWVARLDGTQYRRLTDDRFRDRGPTWSPDGKEIAFYSDRSGSYQVWTIHPDGSGLAQRTSVDGSSVHFPKFSPDGSKLSLGLTTSSRGWILLDWSTHEEKPPSRLMPTVGNTESFWPQAWSPDGTRVAGPIGHANGTVGRVVSYDLSKERYDVLYDGGDTQWKFVSWMRDGRRLVLRDSRGIWLLDPATKRLAPLVAVRGYCVGRSVGLTGNDRFLTWTETGTEGDIWLAELR